MRALNDHHLEMSFEEINEDRLRQLEAANFVVGLGPNGQPASGSNAAKGQEILIYDDYRERSGEPGCEDVSADEDSDDLEEDVAIFKSQPNDIPPYINNKDLLHR